MPQKLATKLLKLFTSDLFNIKFYLLQSEEKKDSKQINEEEIEANLLKRKEEEKKKTDEEKLDKLRADQIKSLPDDFELEFKQMISVFFKNKL